MIVIRDPMQIVSIPDPAIRSLVSRRMEETCAGEEFDADINGYMIVVEPGDNVTALEQEVGCPIMHNLFGEARYGEPDFSPCFEVLEEHPGCYEMVFIMTDGDFGISLFIPKTEGINPELLAMCAEYAVPAPDLAEA
jgi:hypothetical protein